MAGSVAVPRGAAMCHLSPGTASGSTPGNVPLFPCLQMRLFFHNPLLWPLIASEDRNAARKGGGTKADSGEGTANRLGEGDFTTLGVKKKPPAGVLGAGYGRAGWRTAAAPPGECSHRAG